MRKLLTLATLATFACTPGADAPPTIGATGVGTVGQSVVCGGQLAEDTFRYGLCVCGDLDMAGALRTSSFRSSTGQVDDDGLAGGVGINGDFGLAGAAFIDGSLVVGGSVSPAGAVDVASELRVGGDFSSAGDFDVDGDAYIAGDVSAILLDIGGTLHTTEEQSSFFISADEMVVEDFDIAPPCGCNDDVPVGDFVAQAASDNDNASANIDAGALDGFAGGQAMTLEPGRYYFDEVNTAGAIFFEVSGPTAIYIDGDLNLAGALFVELNSDDATLDIFVTGDINTAGYLELGSVERPADVRLYLAGEGEINLAGALQLGGAIWAPNTTLSAAGDVHYAGSLLVGDIASAGTIRASFDADLNDEGQECEPEPQPVDDGEVDPNEPEPTQPEPEEPTPVEPPQGCDESLECPSPEICVEGECILFEG